jgi:hypothetical protein
MKTSWAVGLLAGGVVGLVVVDSMRPPDGALVNWCVNRRQAAIRSRVGVTVQIPS